MDLDAGIRNEIIALAKNYGIRKVILFGSRARGDNGARSDIDLAVSGGDITGFRLDIDDEVRTLLMFDVVNLDGRFSRLCLTPLKGRELFCMRKLENFSAALNNLRLCIPVMRRLRLQL